MDDQTTVGELRRLVGEFRDSRNWRKFHTPKDLAASICIESAELLEVFQWKSEAEVREFLSKPRNERIVAHEVADVVSYCLSLCDVLGIDLSTAMQEKCGENAKRFPPTDGPGRAGKYFDF